MYVSVKPSWFVTTGRIEKHTKNQNGKIIKEFVGSFKNKEIANNIVELLNKQNDRSNNSTSKEMDRVIL